MIKCPLRVLLVATHPVQYSSPIFRLLAEDPRLEIEVAYCSMQGAESRLDPGFGIQVKWDIPLLESYPWIQVPNYSPVPRVGPFFGLFNPGIWRLISRGKFNAVVLYTGYMCATFWIALAAAKWNRVPVLFGTDATTLQPRDHKSWKLSVKRQLVPAILRLADVALAPSEAGRQFIAGMGISESRVALTPFVVDNDWWRQRASEVGRSSVRQKWEIPDEALVALFCAKLQPWKRPDDVLRAFARVNVKGTYLVFAGEGPMRANLESTAKSLGVADRVRFLGFVNQSALPSVYCSADLFILPSEYDPCPAVVCEAMLCGCPVVLSDEIRGRFDLVRNGETGFIYPSGNIDALARILSNALADRNKLNELGRAAVTRMETWSPRENVDGTVRALKQACNHGR